MRTLVGAVWGACLLSLSAITTAWAAAPSDWKPELLPAAGSMRAPSEPIRIAVPALSTDKLEPLALELNGLDVTLLVAREPGRLVFTPPQPLAWGRHQLRLVERATNGEILERGRWIVEIRKSSAFREAQLQSNIDLNVTQRTSQRWPDAADAGTQLHCGCRPVRRRPRRCRLAYRRPGRPAAQRSGGSDATQLWSWTCGYREIFVHRRARPRQRGHRPPIRRTGQSYHAGLQPARSFRETGLARVTNLIDGFQSPCPGHYRVPGRLWASVLRTTALTALSSTQGRLRRVGTGLAVSATYLSGEGQASTV